LLKAQLEAQLDIWWGCILYPGRKASTWSGNKLWSGRPRGGTIPTAGAGQEHALHHGEDMQRAVGEKNKLKEF
jgi:hypothetical protein